MSPVVEAEHTAESIVRRFARIVANSTPDVPTSLRGDHEAEMARRRIEADRPLVPAAVLVPLVDRADGVTVLLTRRSENLAHHAGQISFPGGHIEPDEGPEEAALRETEEEVGLSRDRVRILGRLDEYITGTGFSVTPIVGLLRPPFEIAPDPLEVAEVFEVPLSFILDPGNHQRHARDLPDGRRRHYYAMPFERYFIWGATAGMLVNLYEVLSRR